MRDLVSKLRDKNFVYMSVGSIGELMEEAAEKLTQLDESFTEIARENIRLENENAALKEEVEHERSIGRAFAGELAALKAQASEPFGIYHVGDTEEESDFFLYKDSGDVSCEHCIKLYTAPQPASAEVERDAARWNAHVKLYSAKLGVSEEDVIAELDAAMQKGGAA